MQFCLLLLLLLSLLSISLSFDISFIPANEDNPSLPLSAKYRDQLRKLCLIVEKSKTLPKELMEKKEVLNKMCFKLKQDDENVAISTAYTEKATKAGMKIFGIVGVFAAAWAAKRYFYEIFGFMVSVIGYFGWKKATQKKTYIPMETNAPTNVDEVPAVDRDHQFNEMREARLKRFSSSTGSTLTAADSNKLD